MQDNSWGDVGERVRKIVGRMQDNPADLEIVTMILTNETAPAEQHKEHTAEQAAQAIMWKMEDLIRQTAAARHIDKTELHRHVFRKLTLTSLRLRDRPNDLVEDVRDVASEYKRSQHYEGAGGSGY